MLLFYNENIGHFEYLNESDISCFLSHELIDLHFLCLDLNVESFE